MRPYMMGRVAFISQCCGYRNNHSHSVSCFFFFKESAPPQILPSSPPRPSPNLSSSVRVPGPPVPPPRKSPPDYTTFSPYTSSKTTAAVTGATDGPVSQLIRSTRGLHLTPY